MSVQAYLLYCGVEGERLIHITRVGGEQFFQERKFQKAVNGNKMD